MSSSIPVGRSACRLPDTPVVVRPPAQEWETYRSGRLHDAAAFGDLACLDKLLSEGTDPNWANPATGLTPLLVASMNGRAECVLSLLRAGADIYAADSQGTTALELYVKLKTTCHSSSKMQPLTVPQPQPDLTSWIMLTLPPSTYTHRFRVCDRLFRSRNYKHDLAHLENADADCQQRSRGQMLDYQGVVVVHPGGELGLVLC